MSYTWNFQDLLQYSELWKRGLWNTLVLSASTIALGTILSVVVFSARRSSFPAWNWAARAYTDLFRALPVFVLLSLIFFVVPILTGWRISAWQSAVIAFALNLAPFAAECVRAGLDSIPSVQYDSGKVLGLTDRQIFRYIIAPQAAQRVIPSLLGEYITTIKLTSLASVVGVEEIWNVGGQIVSRTSLTIEARIASAGLYLLLILPLIWGLTRLERRYGLRGVMGNLHPA